MRTKERLARGGARRAIRAHLQALLAAPLLWFAASGAGAAPVGSSPLEAPGPIGSLRGTLLTPSSGSGPVVLILPASGPTDRNGDNPLGVKAAPYRLLAEALAARGVASVRIDKRGLFESAGAVANADSVTLADYADDAHAWIASARAATGAPCVWVLGHSEGALVALAAAQRPQHMCGLILAAAPGRPLGEVLREQLRANPANAPLLAEADAALSALEAGKAVDAARLNPALLPLFRPSVQHFLISILSLDPAKLIANYKGPVALIQGDADLQIGVADAERLKAADPAARLTILKGVNHVLKVVDRPGRSANLATYADPTLPIAPGVVDAVVGFIASGR